MKTFGEMNRMVKGPVKGPEDPDNMRLTFENLTHDQLVDVAIHLYNDSMRLRRELDDAAGIIR